MAMQSQEFALLMQKELDANSGKGDWNAWKPSHRKALAELDHHVAKLQIAVRAGARLSTLEYAADVGNLAMKIADLFGAPPVCR